MLRLPPFRFTRGLSALALVACFGALPTTGCLFFSVHDDGGPAAEPAVEPAPDPDRDSGTSPDSGVVEPEANDAGIDDAGIDDAGQSEPSDAGGNVDGGSAPDGGVVALDGGVVAPDGGVVAPDAGVVDAGPLDGGVNGLNTTVTSVGPYLFNDVISIRVVATTELSSLDLVDEFEDGLQLIQTSSTPEGMLITIRVGDVDALMGASSVFERAVPIPLNFAADGSNLTEVETVEIHRAHGPYVRATASPVGVCGHPLRPCGSLNNALTHFAHRMTTANDSRWKDSRYLRLAAEGNLYPLSSDPSSTTVAVNGIGIVGGYSPPNPLVNADWAAPVPGETERSNISLDPGVRLLWTATPGHQSAARLENVQVTGGLLASDDVLVTTEFFREAFVLNSKIVGASVDNGMLLQGTTAMRVGAAAAVTIDADSSVLGVETGGIIMQTDVTPVVGIESEGSLVILGSVRGADEIGAAGGLATPAGCTGLRVLSGVTQILGGATVEGGSAPSVTGIRVDGGTLTTTDAFVRGGQVNGLASETQTAIGLESVGSPNLSFTGGVFEGGGNANTAIGVLMTPATAPGSSSFGGGVVFRSGEDQNESAQVAHGLKINQSAPFNVTVTIAAGGISAIAYPTQDGSAVRLRSVAPGTLTVETAAGGIPILAETSGVGFPQTIAGIEIANPGVTLVADVDVTISADASGHIIGIDSQGHYQGAVDIEVESLSSLTPVVEGIRCGRNTIDTGGIIEVPVLGTSTIELLRGDISASDALTITKGLLAGYGCDATINNVDIDGDSDVGKVVGIGIHGGAVTMVNGEVDVDGLDPLASHTGIEMECLSSARLDVTGTQIFVDGGTFLANAGRLAGIALDDRGQAPACSDASIRLLDASVEVGDTHALAGSVATGILAKAANATHQMEVKIVDSSVTVGTAIETAALDLDVTNAVVWLEDAVISGHTGPDGANTELQRTAMKLEFRSLPSDVVAWNSLFRMEGPARRSAAIYLNAKNNDADIDTPVPIYLVHSTVRASAAATAIGIMVDSTQRTENASLNHWDVMQLMGTLVLASDGTGIQEMCRYDAPTGASTYAQVTPLDESVDVIVAPTENHVVQGGAEQCKDVATAPSIRYIKALFENSVTLLDGHCLGPSQPGSNAVPTVSVGTLMVERAFGIDDYSAVDHSGCERPFPNADVGRCQRPCPIP